MRLDDFLKKTPDAQPKRMAVAVAESEEVLEALAEAVKLGIVEPILIGDAGKIRSIAGKMALDFGTSEIVDRPDAVSAAKTAVELVRSGQAKVLMKGSIVSSILMKAILNKETGIRASDSLSIVSVIESPALDRLLFLSDGGMIPYPTFEQKIDIINNAVPVMRNLGIEQPRVACLAALELVNPKMPPTMEAAALALMSQRGQIKGCTVDGPYQLDNALFPEAVREKHLTSPSGVAGCADMVLVPNIETGNVMLKALRYLGGCGIAGMMAGASVPVVMSSRADTVVNKLRSIAVAIAAAN